MTQMSIVLSWPLMLSNLPHLNQPYLTQHNIMKPTTQMAPCPIHQVIPYEGFCPAADLYSQVTLRPSIPDPQGHTLQ